jgi:hypothetical protein
MCKRKREASSSSSRNQTSKLDSLVFDQTDENTDLPKIPTTTEINKWLKVEQRQAELALENVQLFLISELASLAASYLEEPPKLLISRNSYWATLSRHRSFLRNWIPFYYNEEKVFLRQVLLDAQRQFSDEKGKCVFKQRMGAILFQRWCLSFDEGECSIEHVDEPGEKFFLVQIRRTGTDKVFLVKEGNHTLFESASLKELFVKADGLNVEEIPALIYSSMKQSLPDTINKLSKSLEGIKGLMQEMEKKSDLKDLTRGMSRIARELHFLRELIVTDYDDNSSEDSEE